MFGLSVKEKLYKKIQQLCNIKLPAFEEELSEFVKTSETLNEEEATREYFGIVGRYSDAVSEELTAVFGHAAAMKAGLAFQSPRITGLPDEITTDYLLDHGPFVGYYFALYYYAVTGNKIALDDYGKFIRPLNQYQVNLIEGVIRKLEGQR